MNNVSRSAYPGLIWVNHGVSMDVDQRRAAARVQPVARAAGLTVIARTRPPHSETSQELRESATR
jgi:hypothetical protein